MLSTRSNALQKSINRVPTVSLLCMHVNHSSTIKCSAVSHQCFALKPDCLEIRRLCESRNSKRYTDTCFAINLHNIGKIDIGL